MDHTAASIVLCQLLLMNEFYCDSQSQYARGMLPYHQVMNEHEELFSELSSFDDFAEKSLFFISDPFDENRMDYNRCFEYLYVSFI